MASNPEARTRTLFREMGYVIDGANRYEMYSGRRHDYIGCVDLIAFNDSEIIAIQATSSSNRSARRRKCLENPDAKRWVMSPHRKFYVVTWGLRKGGETRRTWKHKIDELKIEDFYV